MTHRDSIQNQPLNIGLVACAILLALFQTESSAQNQNPAVDKATPLTAAKTEEPATRLRLTEEEVDTLISQLDSASFVQREEATQKLAQCGSEVLGKLTSHFFESSSEAGWRINRILEGISRNEDEDVFLRSAAIIRVLFGDNDQESRRKLQKLQTQRMLKQRKQAAKSLSQSGFNVDAPQPKDNDLFGVAAAPFGAREFIIEGRGRLMVVDGRVVSLSESTEPSPQVEKIKDWKDPRANPAKTLSRIEEIIENDIDENRDFLSGVLPRSNANLPPAKVTFPKGKTDPETKTLLGKLGPVSHVQFNGQNITPEMIQLIGSDRLQNVDFQNCTFELDELESFPQNVTELSFAGSVPSSNELFSFLKKKCQLNLDGIEFDKSLVSAVKSNKIQMLKLRSCDFDAANLQAAMMSRGLYQVTFSRCKIDVKTINSVRKLRPDLQVLAEPEAFLGVQGPLDITTAEITGCQISRVVADSGAEKSGMQPGDIVVQIDGQKISRFDDLRLLVSQGKAGDELKVKVMRDGEAVDLKVTLSEMDAFR